MKQKIGILGVGNLLLADEGFGVHCIRQLEESFVFPPNIELLDGGTAGIMLAPFMEDKKLVLVIDVVNSKDAPGTILTFDDSEVSAGNIQTRMSPHQVGLLEILDLCRLRGKAPQVEMITVVPGDLSTRIGLSEPLTRAMDEVIERLLARLAALDIHPVPAALAAGA
jgi:hydrogenase maturation protease